MTQLDDLMTEVQWGMHINFGGNLPAAVVNGCILPNFNGVVSQYQAHFTNILILKNLAKTDGKILGEVLVYQVRSREEQSDKLGMRLFCSLFCRATSSGLGIDANITAA